MKPLTLDPHSLASWYSENLRNLPWRLTPAGSRDPYLTLVSELMLQQTQVKSMVAKFVAWKNRFPTLASLAIASEAEVLKHWAGLGYYARARNLLRAAIHLSQKDSIPQNLEEWLKVPGVGPYTAGAILSLCFNQAVPILDGNVERVLSRLYCVDRVGSEKERKVKLWGIAEQWSKCRLSGKKKSCPGLINEALMELGALICTPSTPKCEDCPLKLKCKAFKSNRVDLYPPKSEKGVSTELMGHILFCQSKEHFFVLRKGCLGLLQNMWMFPCLTEAEYHRHLSMLPKVKKSTVIVKHSITTHRLQLSIHCVTKKTIHRFLASGIWTNFENSWIMASEFEEYFHSSLPNKVLKKIIQL